MTNQPKRTDAKPARKPTEISDLPQADGADQAEQVRGGATIVPCVRTREIVPCVKPGEIIPCIRNR